MPVEKRRKQFTQAVLARLPVPAKINVNYGSSNLARFIEGALLIPEVNLENGINQNPQAWCNVLSISMNTESEIHVAVVVQESLHDLRDRLVEMLANQSAKIDHPVLGTIKPYSDRNNHTNFYVTSGAVLYTAARTMPVAYFDAQLGELLGHPVQADHVYYAVYPPTLSARNHPTITGTLQDLRAMIGSRLSELYVWPAEPALPESMFHMPGTMTLDDIRHRVEALGGIYATDILDSFHCGLSFLDDKHFVILTGLSGTGKTSLVRRYAHAVHGLSTMEQNDPLFFLCPVRPDWTDPLGLTGHFDVFTQRYVVPEFLQAVLRANAYQSCPVFVCLDEMNLARVEYYFSDVLSAMETGLPLRLHTYSESVASDLGVQIPPIVPWPRNLFIIGTVNVDETTHTISDKVLDRAQLIDTSQTNFQPLFDRLAEESPQMAWSVTRCGVVLTKVNEILRAHLMGFGYRVPREVIRYHAFAVPSNNNERSNVVLDQQLRHKVLVKLRGTERQRDMLIALQALLVAYPQSLLLVNQMLEDLAEGWFQATR